MDRVRQAEGQWNHRYCKHYLPVLSENTGPIGLSGSCAQISTGLVSAGPKKMIASCPSCIFYQQCRLSSCRSTSTSYSKIEWKPPPPSQNKHLAIQNHFYTFCGLLKSSTSKKKIDTFYELPRKCLCCSNY